MKVFDRSLENTQAPVLFLCTSLCMILYFQYINKYTYLRLGLFIFWRLGRTTYDDAAAKNCDINKNCR